MKASHFLFLLHFHKHFKLNILWLACGKRLVQVLILIFLPKRLIVAIFFLPCARAGATERRAHLANRASSRTSSPGSDLARATRSRRGSRARRRRRPSSRLGSGTAAPPWRRLGGTRPDPSSCWDTCSPCEGGQNHTLLKSKR